MAATKTASKPETYSALRAEFQDKSVKGKNRAPSNYTVSLDIGGDLFLLTSSGYTMSVPDSCLEGLKAMLEQFYKITTWEVTSGKNQARRSEDFDVETAVSIASDLTGKALDIFIEDDTRKEVLELRGAEEVDNGDY